MKLKSLSTVIVASIAITLASCGKTSKGKLDGEWKVTSYQYIQTSVEDGDTEIQTSKHDGSTYTSLETVNGQQTDDDTYKVLEHTYVFKKDGTWSTVYTTEKTNVTGPVTTIITTTQNKNGVWNFVKTNKDEDFKMNERISLTDTGGSTKTSTITKNGTVSNTTENTTLNSTYTNANYASILEVEESKKKELILKSIYDIKEASETFKSEITYTLTAK